MLHRITRWILVLPLLAACLAAQGLDTKATKDDWEEINFEFNSSVLVDGYPSLLRLAELLQSNAPFRVRLEGHTDRLGGAALNQRLGLARAGAVRDFLVKYGARATQIDVSTRGFESPRATGAKSTFQRTDEARWMNRRVALTVLDGQGRTVSAGGTGDAIRAMQQPGAAGSPGAAGAPGTAGMTDCCSEVLRKLDKLDGIERMLKDLSDQNKKLAEELAAVRQGQDGLRQNQQALENRVNQAGQQAAQVAQAAAAAPKPPTAAEVAKVVTDELDKKKDPRFQVLNLNAGPNSDGNASFTGSGRYFAPFGEHYALQAGGEYVYFKGPREGQVDFGLVDRIGRFQAGLFSSFKHVNLTGDQTGGTLGQGAVTLNYLFKWGKIGAYGTKAFLDDAVVNRVQDAPPGGGSLYNFATERYLRVVDQAGIAATAPLFGANYFEGNLGYLKSTGYGDRVGGTLRLIFPIRKLPLAFTVEGGINETMLGRGNDGRAVVGLQFGSFMRPKEQMAANHAVPVQIPRVRYEVLTRRVRTGNGAPVADAGVNQTLPRSQTVTLNGSGSYDPDGDAFTYQWAQESGPGVTLSAATSALTTFAAVQGQNYAFRLTVKDTSGAQSSARVTVTTLNGDVKIVSFTAVPTSMGAGQTSTLSWQVLNADTVTVTSLGQVGSSASATVSPLTTTTYTLTATQGSQTQTATVTVNVGPVRIVSFTNVPPGINYGKTSSLNFVVENATKVTITGVGTDYTSPTLNSGSLAVAPSSTTTYTLTVSNATSSSTAQVTVTVSNIPPQVSGQ